MSCLACGVIETSILLALLFFVAKTSHAHSEQKVLPSWHVKELGHDSKFEVDHGVKQRAVAEMFECWDLFGIILSL
jgi:hypothetical protein